MKTIAFFTNKGGVGKTSLVYHCAWMLVEQGHRVLIADLDPQSNLSAMALDNKRLETLWLDESRTNASTIYGAIAPLFDGTGDIRSVHIEPLTEGLGLLVGDLALARIEDDMSTQWAHCLGGKERAFRVTTAFWRVIREAAARQEADVVLIDVSPSLGSINRAALVASTHVVVPVTPDLFSLQGLKNLGPTLRQWRDTWQQALLQAPRVLGDLPQGQMEPIGYVLTQCNEEPGEEWQVRLSDTYRESVLGGVSSQICRVRCYPDLMPLAMKTHKPMFDLTVADSATIAQCRTDFEMLTNAIAKRCG